MDVHRTPRTVHIIYGMRSYGVGAAIGFLHTLVLRNNAIQDHAAMDANE